MADPGASLLQDDAPAPLPSDVPPPPEAPSPTTDATATGDGLTVLAPKKERGFDMEVGFRGKYMTLPDAIMNIWFHSAKDEGWAYTSDRPKAHAYSLGLEFIVKSKERPESRGGANGIFYVDWVANLTDEGYWDDVEEPPNFLDGDYLVPSKGFGMVIIGADYAYELHMVKTAQTKGKFGLSMLVGFGLGVAVFTGYIDEWSPGEDGRTSYEQYEAGDPPEGKKRIPPVLPVVDINLALRMNFANRFTLRFEGGLHDMIYFGGSAGVMF
jgi:hypothetical protein